MVGYTMARMAVEVSGHKYTAFLVSSTHFFTRSIRALGAKPEAWLNHDPLSASWQTLIESSLRVTYLVIKTY